MNCTNSGSSEGRLRSSSPYLRRYKCDGCEAKCEENSGSLSYLQRYVGVRWCVSRQSVKCDVKFEKK